MLTVATLFLKLDYSVAISFTFLKVSFSNIVFTYDELEMIRTGDILS